MRRLLLILLLAPGCKKAIDSNKEAELAAIGLEGAIERAMGLGFDGFNAASSANIPEQTGAGDVQGTMTVNGQVDQGASDNKGMRLQVALVDYADIATVELEEEDPVTLVYDTVDPLAIELSLRDIPAGTMTGTVAGDVQLSGDLEGDVTLELTMEGEIEPDGDGTKRVEGTTTVVGTATNAGGGTYDVDLTL